MTTVDWKANGFNLGIARALAECSSIVYDDDKEKAKGVLQGKYGMEWVQFFRNEDTEALITYNKDALVFAFRGTSSMQDALTDIKIKLIDDKGSKGKIHEGFKTGLDKVWNQVWNTIGRKRSKRSIWITGHSLGGALALTAAARLQFEKTQSINGLYTFGQPRVGNSDFTNACNKAFGNHYYRFVHNNDVVPRVPLRLMGFEHTGIFKYINKDKRLDDSLTWEQITKDRFSGRIDAIIKPGSDGISDHSMVNYLEALSK